MYAVIKERVVFEPEILKLFPVLAKASNKKTVEFVILALYYGSPFARYPENERWILARKKVFGQKEIVKEELPDFDAIKHCIEGFQYDERRNTLRNYEEKIRMLNDRLYAETNQRELSAIDVSIERLEKRVKAMQLEITREEEAVMIKGGGVLSYLEEWQEKMRKKKERDQYIREHSGVEEL